MSKKNDPVNRGDEVTDIISGLGGVVIGITDWMYGCRRLFVQAKKAKDGKPAEPFTVDEPQVKVVKRAAVAAADCDNKENILGWRVKDRVCGLSGIVFGITRLAFSEARRIHILPETHKDGRPADLFTVDEGQVEVVEKNVVPVIVREEAVKEAKSTHGPRDERGFMRHDGPHRYDGF